MIKQPVAAKDVITNEWIGEINNFKPGEIAAQAKKYAYR
jgi:hypothetical protein